jgi:hypothetical protein
MRERHGVRPGTSWGSLTAVGQQRWRTLDCDRLDPYQAETRRTEASYLSEYATRLRVALEARPAERRIARNDSSSVGWGARVHTEGAGAKKTVVSVCVCTTSRHTEATRLEDLALFQIMLPSLRDSLRPRSSQGGSRAASSSAAAGAGAALAMAPTVSGRLDSWFASVASVVGGAGSSAPSDGADTAGGGHRVGNDADDEAPLGGEGAFSSTTAPPEEEAPSATSAEPFEYWLYVLYDAGDAFFDSAEREAEVRSWISTELSAPLAALGVTLRFALLRFENVLRKPGPAFNFMMAAAAADGAEYLYRVNDDTQFVGAGWAAQAVGALRRYSPPNVGVVGPVCREGNTRILTHDLVHRTHLRIFEHYYPPIFSDWWMDDWITHVYGPSRTRRGPFLVRHHTGHQGTRYEVDQSHEKRLAVELQSGKARIERWLLREAST